MPTKVKSTSLDTQTFITASSGGATLRGNWYIGTSGLGSSGTNPGTLTGPLTGNADTATKLSPGKAINGTTYDGSVDITVKVNTTSNPATGTYYPVFVPSSTAGNQQASTSNSTGFTFNPATNALTVSGNIGAANFSGSSSGTNTGDQNLSGYALLSGATFTGAISATNLSGTNTGDQNLSGYALLSGATFTGAISATNLSGTNTGDQNLAPYAVAANLATVATSGSYNDLSNKPVLATVATSGSYNDLSNKPVLATVATSGSYNDLSNKPVTGVSSVNGQTGAVNIVSGVTSVNGQTGAVNIFSVVTSVNMGYPGDGSTNGSASLTLPPTVGVALATFGNVPYYVGYGSVGTCSFSNVNTTSPYQHNYFVGNTTIGDVSQSLQLTVYWSGGAWPYSGTFYIYC